MNNRLRLAFLLAVAVAALSGCARKETPLNRTLETDKPWSYNEPLCFECRIADTSLTYDLTFWLKHEEDFAWMNAFFFVHTVFPDMESACDTLECLLADASGRWCGTRFGKYYSLGFLYKQGIKFPLPGEYRFEIRHGMREDNLDGITAVGLKIRQSEK